MNKVKDFVKSHKKEIAAGVLTAVVGGCAYTIGKRVGIQGYFEKETKLLDGTVACPKFHVSMPEPLTIGDIGKLGDIFLAHDAELTKDTKILAVGAFEFE